MAKVEKDIFLKKLGENIAKLRRERKISQVQLSYDAEIDLGTISKLERGLLNISVYNAFKISKALGVKYKDIFDF